MAVITTSGSHQSARGCCCDSRGNRRCNDCGAGGTVYLRGWLTVYLLVEAGDKDTQVF